MRYPRLLVVLAVLGYLALLGLLRTVSLEGSANGQVPKPAKPQVGFPVAPQAPAKPGEAKPDEEDGFGDRVILPRARKAEQKVARIREMIVEEDWSNVVRLLQSMLDIKEDEFLQDEKGRWVSVRTEANRIIGQLPRDGRQFYEQQYGSAARKKLKEGLASGDPQAYAEVALRYMHTEAGAEAAEHLGTYHLTHGRYIVAALCFERLLDREGTLEKLPAVQLLKAAIAFERAGDPKNRDRVWEQFVRRVENGDRLPPSLRRMDTSQLRALLALKDSGRPTREHVDWPMFLGAPDRAALADGGAPFLAPRFRVSMFDDPSDIEKFSSDAKSWVENALSRHNSRAQAQLSGFHPLAVGGRLIFRNYWGVYAYNVKSGELDWKAPGKMSLHFLGANRGRIDVAQQMSSWISTYQQHTPSIFYDNSTLGTLSADNSKLYFVEDLAVPPHPSLMNINRWNVPQISGELAGWMEHNLLSALNLHTGKLEWSIGTDQPDQPFTGAFFLGPPLPLGGRLYVLAEMGSGEIRLLCIENRRADDKYEKAELVWSQTLCLVDRRITEDPARRLQAANLAYGDGVLVCPTNAGVVLAVDLLTRSLVWAHSYHEAGTDTSKPTQKVPGMGGMGYQVNSVSAPNWATAAPIVRDGRVVFTAPDGESVRCLNLRDGMLVWREPRQNDLYLAGVFADKVVLVGKELIRALSFKDGKELWKVSTGLPAGRGASNGRHYFLPLKSGEVWTIDLATGEVQAKSRAARQPEGLPSVTPGNLVFHEGDVLSQSATMVAVFPQLAVKESAITALLKSNPNDPRGLTERGDLRLNRGELAGAVADLRAALAQKEVPADVQRTARERLYEALGDLLHKDFAANEGQLKEYEALVPIVAQPGESAEAKAKREEDERDRKARLFRIVAKGREEQGRLKEALAAYLDFVKLGRKELIPIPEEQATRALPEVWIQGRISELMRRAKPEQRKALDEAFEEQWKKAQQAGDLDTLEQFANLFGPICMQGQRARLLLADKLVEQNQFEQAQIKLWALARQADPTLAALALEGLARINTRLGELENAAYFYRVLAQRYPKVIIRDGKTAAEVYLDLATDKRFLPYLEEPRRGWMLLGPGERFDVTSPFYQYQQQPQLQTFTLEPDGEVPPFFRRHRLQIDQQHNTFKLLDAASNGVRGEFALNQALRPLYYSNSVPRFRPTYSVAGGMVVFAWGPFIYGYDPQKPKESLWYQSVVGEMDLAAAPNFNGMVPQIGVNQNGQLEIWYTDGTRERLGTLGPVQPAQVIFLAKDEGLVAVDPLQVAPATKQKRPLKRWVKSDVPIGTDIFGDAEFLYLAYPGRDGSTGRTAALRAIDGAPVEVPDFSALYQRRLKTVGRCLLLREDANGATRLRLYDVHTGKDVWSKATDPQAIVLDSYVEDLAGLAEPSGKLMILNVESGQEVLTAQLDAAAVAKTPEIRLLRDGAQVYVAFNLPVDPNEPINKRRTIYPTNMLRAVNVNGPLYAFDRATGQQRWQREVPPQALVVEQFEEMPILLFASLQQFWLQPQGAGAGQPPLQRQENIVLALDKRDGFDGRGGKDKSGQENHVYLDARQNAGQFTSLRVDPRAGLIELFAHNYKIVFRLTTQAASAAGGADSSALPQDSPVQAARPLAPVQIVPQPGQVLIQQLQRARVEEVRRLQEIEEIRRAIQEKKPTKK